MEKVYKAEDADFEPEADVLRGLLIESAATREQGQSWLDAANRGHALHLLRQERARYGPVNFPVWEYLAGLARQARITLDAVLAAFELDSPPVVSRLTAGRISKVLSHIGCPLEDTLRMLRLSFAEVHGFTVKGDISVVHRVGSAKETDACEKALRRAEVAYSEELRAELEEQEAD
jgi:hypothetical protein